MTRVHLGSVLHSYTKGAEWVDAEGSTLGDLLADLERRHPGIRFRVVDEQDQVRRHMAVFVGQKPVRKLAAAIPADAEVHILAALSGG